MNLPLTIGSHGGAVDRLQRVLGLHASGVLDTATSLAIAAWQRLRGLPDHGVVDAATWDRLAVHLMAEARARA